jgi:hypothetical protein
MRSSRFYSERARTHPARDSLLFGRPASVSAAGYEERIPPPIGKAGL